MYKGAWGLHRWSIGKTLLRSRYVYFRSCRWEGTILLSIHLKLSPALSPVALLSLSWAETWLHCLCLPLGAQAPWDLALLSCSIHTVSLGSFTHSFSFSSPSQQLHMHPCFAFSAGELPGQVPPESQIQHVCKLVHISFSWSFTLGNAAPRLTIPATLGGFYPEMSVVSFSSFIHSTAGLGPYHLWAVCVVENAWVLETSRSLNPSWHYHFLIVWPLQVP